MKKKFIYQSPIVIYPFRWGITFAVRPLRIKIRPPRPTDPEDSMLIYDGLFDED